MEIKSGSTDEKIVEATYRILQKEGSEKATTKRIAAEAGVNEVTIFRNFKNKQNLIDVVKEYYLQKFIKQLEKLFDFDEDIGIEEYLEDKFAKVINLPDAEFSIIKIAVEEVREIPEKKLLISKITDAVLDKLEDFFKLQLEKGTIRDLDPKMIALVSFSLIFQSVILWRIYNQGSDIINRDSVDTVMDILFNGIAP